MRKRSKYKPRPAIVDTMAHVKVLVSTLSSNPALVDLRLKNHSAMVSLTRGNATKSEMDVIIAALNITEALCGLGHGAEYTQEVMDGMDALHAVCVRGAQPGRFILRPMEMQAINQAMDVHNAQLEIITVGDLEKARQTVVNTIKRRQAVVIEDNSKSTDGSAASVEAA